MWKCGRFSCFYSCTEPSLMFVKVRILSSLKKSTIEITTMYWPYSHCLSVLEVAVQMNMFWDLTAAQIPSLRFLRSVLPCWLHMGSGAPFRQLNLKIQNRFNTDTIEKIKSICLKCSIGSDQFKWSLFRSTVSVFSEEPGKHAISKLSIGLCSTLPVCPCSGAPSSLRDDSECHYAW